jgi:hypothetical protein
MADILADAGVSVEPIHSDLTRTERDERLGRLRRGRIKALVAPAILDEGIDVPDVDLGIVMGGSKSRRQMIQRMGRVLRLKQDGRRATFVVVYARHTSEDLSVSDGAEGCLDLIVGSADTVEEWRIADGRIESTPVRVGVCGRPDDQVPDLVTEEARPDDTDVAPEPTTVAANVEAAPPAPGGGVPTRRLHPPLDADMASEVIVSYEAVRDYQELHGGDADTAEALLWALVQDFARDADVTRSGDSFLLARHGCELELTANRSRLVGYWAASPVKEGADALPDVDRLISAPADEESPDGAEPAPANASAAGSEEATSTSPPVGRNPSSELDLVGQLERLAHLHQVGALTDEEFAAAKHKLLRQA